MQDLLYSESDDEINVRELFITLWAYKLFIVSICAIGIALAGYYVQNVEKQYTSTAIFNLDQTSTDTSFSETMGSLANLVGFGNSSTTGLLTIDQVNGRIFIEELDVKLNFQADTYFNTYNPNATEPIWKSFIKLMIGWQKSTKDPKEAIWQDIVSNYTKKVKIDQTPDGSVRIMVTHVIAERAAEIANTIMNEIINNTKSRKNTNQDEQLSYMSNTLAKALNDLEVSQSKLKEFALNNSALPLESFAAGSLKLEALRQKLSRTSELHDAVAALYLILQNKNLDQNDYIDLRQKFPIIDQVEFRRVLGQNEIISSWTWPDAISVNAVFDTLTERKNRLQSQINASQINAERSSLALETYKKLEREAKVAEATYTVLIEQVKAQSMAAGYRPDRSEVYDFASASINPSSPKQNLVLPLGAFLGLFVGAAISLSIALRRGVYYSKNSLKTAAQAHLTASVRNLLPLRNKNLNILSTVFLKNPNTTLRNLAVEIHKSSANQVVVTSSRAKLTSNDMARALACYMQSDTMRVAVIDFSEKIKKSDIDVEKLSGESFVVSESLDNVSVLRPNNNMAAMELLSQRDFLKNMQSLSSTIDLLFLCADNNDAISLLRAIEGQKTFHILVARTKNTKSDILKHMRSLLPIQGLIYD